MRTPGLGDMRFSSTSGVLPIDWTMSPYLPPQGRLPRCGSSIASESVVLQPGDVCEGQSMLARTCYEQLDIVVPRSHVAGLLLHHLVRDRSERGAVEQHLDVAPPIGEAGALLLVQLGEAQRQLVHHAPDRAARVGHDVDHPRAPADRAAPEREPVAGQLSGAKRAIRRAPGAELRARHV